MITLAKYTSVIYRRTKSLQYKSEVRVKSLRTVEMTVDFQGMPPYTHSLPPPSSSSLLWSTSWPLNHHFSGPELVLTHRYCLEEGPSETELPVATQDVQRATGDAGHLLCGHCSINLVFFCHCAVWLIHKTTGTNCNKQSGLQRGTSGLIFLPSRTCRGVGPGTGQLTSLQTPHILDSNEHRQRSICNSFLPLANSQISQLFCCETFALF
ncbi:hypothetical protein XENOCAPTIV_010399 [Xenoophorus captivus]|uniref:Uncharacterized protein n=1 Tax=Xenoophorus captivus TaxID=1517983 RepID=A0ABV0QZV3_9TELE